ANLRCSGMDVGGTPFYNLERGVRPIAGYPRTDARGGRDGAAPPRTAPPRPERGIELSDTMHLHDLTPAERLVEEAAERGFVEEKELEAFADEHELAEDDVAALRTALEERDVVVRAETPAAGHAPAPTGTLDPLQL